MKVITSEIDFIVYNKIFRHLKANRLPLVVWQLVGDKREISNSHLNSYHHDSKLLHFEHQNNVKFNPVLPIFCYSEDAQLIFKTKVHELADNYLSLIMPSELKLMDDPEVKVIRGSTGHDLSTVWRVKRLNVETLEDGPDYIRVKSMEQRSSRDQDFLNSEFDGVSVDEEDRLFADKRESPRARPKADKKVKVKLAEAETVQLLKLFDLSRGGMSFVTDENDSFPKGAIIHVTGFDSFDLDDPLIGKVMSLRPLDEGNFEWKVGVKFDDGQA